jgi:hypothetical protein
VTPRKYFPADTTVAAVETYLRQVLKHEGALFLFCASSFAPTPDQSLAFLLAHFGSPSPSPSSSVQGQGQGGGGPGRGELVVSYGFTEVWG